MVNSKNKNKKIILLVIILFSQLIFGLNWLYNLNNQNISDLESFKSPKTSLSEWKFSRTIALDPATPKNSYQVKLILNDSNFDFTHVSYGGRDIRFLDENQNQLNYWIENWDNSSDTIIWVKIPDIGTSQFTMYYGNPLAEPKSDGEKTFIFFDDFEGSSLNLTKWNTDDDQYSSITVSNSQVRLYTRPPSVFYERANYGFHDYYIEHGQTYGYHCITGGALFTPSENNWLTGQMNWINSTSAPYYENDILYSDDTDNPTGPLPVRFFAHTAYYGPGTHWGSVISSNNETIGIPGRSMRLRTWLDKTDEVDIRIDWLMVHEWSEQPPEVSIGIENPNQTPPIIVINSPQENDSFFDIPPDFDLFIYDPNLDKTWYTLDNGNTNITFIGLVGTIDSMEWVKQDYGNISIRFYANNTWGNMSYAEVNVQKVKEGWKYLREISINPSTPEYNYQVKIELTPSNFNYSNVKANGEDIRFMDNNFESLFYWIETWNPGGISTIWIKIVDVGTSNIYMKYGNELAQSESNGDNVFLLFDDFEGSSLDSSKWTSEVHSYCGISVSNSIIRIYSDAPSTCMEATALGFHDTYVLEGQTYGTRDITGGASFSGSEDNWVTGEMHWINSTTAPYYEDDVLYSDDTDNPSGPLPVRLLARTVYYGPGRHYGAWISSLNDTLGIPGRSLRLRLWEDRSGISDIRVDWLGVRKWSETEIIATLSDEYEISDPPILFILDPEPNQIFGKNAPYFKLFIFDLNLNTTWYSLDDGITNITFSGYEGYFDQSEWTGLFNGTVTINFYANDSLGNISKKSVSIRKDIYDPVISINNPNLDEIFGKEPPIFDINVEESNIESMWYTIDNGLTNITFYEFNGTIDKSEWKKIGNDTIAIRFYVLDKAGNLGIAEVSVIKEISDPFIIIHNPKLNEVFGFDAPNFNISVIEADLDSMWYTLDNGLTNVTHYQFNGTISQLEWNKKPTGNVNIRFYAMDTFGNIGYTDIVIEKDITTPTIIIYTPSEDGIFGYDSPSYNIDVIDPNFDAMWYSLDNGITNIQILSLTGSIDQEEWDKRSSGVISLKFYANDTVGNNDYMEVIIVKDLVDPVVSIISPDESDIFGDDPPNFEISVMEANLETMWYTLDDGITNIEFLSFTGTISQTEWNKKNTGEVIIRFYAMDEAGNEAFKAISVNKDIDLPIITINNPKMNDFANDKAPEYELSVQEPHLDLMWYTLDYGMTNYYFTEFTGVIDEVEWDKYGNVSVVIRFYVRDQADNEAFAEVLLNKDLYNPIVTIEAPEFGVDIVDFSPVYSVSIVETNLNRCWYTIDNGLTNHTIIALNGILDVIVWNSAPDGPVTIIFYASDKAGNIGFDQVIVIKRTTQHQLEQLIPGYNIFAIIGIICLISLIIFKRKFQS